MVESVHLPDQSISFFLLRDVRYSGDVVCVQPVGAPGELRVEPVHQKVAHQELVARHVEEEQRLPDVPVAAGNGEFDERPVAPHRVEAPAQNEGHVA